jgi:hypothetical protein
MLVSHSKKFIYIKTVKTAGTSVEVALQKYCVPPKVDMPTKKVGMDTIESDYGIVGKRGESVSDSKWYNHMPATRIRNQLPAETWDSYCKVCNIRNPWDKTVSWFHFRNPDVKGKPQDEIIAEFRAFLRPEDDKDLRIGHDTHIYFIDDVPVADEYIRYETLEEDFARVCDRLDLDIRSIPELKRGPRGKKVIPYQAYYDDELRDKIAAIYHREIEHFGWSF